MTVRRHEGLLRDTLVLAAAALSLLGCGQGPAPSTRVEAHSADLAEGVAARVGDDVILVSSVRRVAAAQKISQEEARSRLVSDALFAAGARERGVETDQRVQVARRAELARALVERLRDEQYAKPITDAEVGEFTALHWLDLDRPEARRSVHAVVLLDGTDDPKRRKAAADLAGRMAQRLAGAKSADEFEESAKAIPADGFQVVVERLPPITEDGRLADLDNRPPPGVQTPTFDLGFVKGLWSVGAVGQVSEPTPSTFGIHVIMLTGIQPAKRMAMEERRTTLAPEIRASRARKALEALTEKLRQQTTIRVERNVDTLTEMLQSGGGH